MHKETNEETKKQLKDRNLAMTTDNWTSIANEGYITVTAHFLDDEFVLKSRVLATVAMPERHTGVNIADRLVDIVGKFDIQASKIKSVVRDGASSMDVCASSLKDTHKWNASSVVCAGT